VNARELARALAAAQAEWQPVAIPSPWDNESAAPRQPERVTPAGGPQAKFFGRPAGP